MKTNNKRDGFEIVMERYLGHSNQPHAELVASQDTRVVFSTDGFLRIYTPEKKVEWTGEGLPPVGTVCEFRVETDDWRQCEVIAHKDDYAVCWIHCNKILASSGHAVRPIRTPEQIAADDREKACQDWLRGIERSYGQAVADKCEDILMDAEKRKQVKVESICTRPGGCGCHSSSLQAKCIYKGASDV